MADKTIQLNGNGEIVIDDSGRTEIYAPHLGEVLAFSLPMMGHNYFKGVMSAIDADNGLRPTTSQTFSLIDLASQNPDNEHCKDILNNNFWTATENNWGREDVIVYDNVDGKMPSDRKSLIKRHKDGDKAVRIVPYGFQTERQSVDELLKNTYVLAQVGDKDMLGIVRRVIERVSKNKPYVWALGFTKENIKRYTTLNLSWNGNGLALVGGCDDRFIRGYASRMRKVA